MPFKPSYDYQRAERARAKKASKDAKLQERKAEVALRKANQAATVVPGDGKVQDSGQ